MARKKLPAFTSWEDVDNAMKLIGQLQGSRSELELDLNRQIASAKERTGTLIKPIDEKVKALAKDIREYVALHRDDLDGKTKRLTFGRTGFRLNTKVVVPKGIPKEDFIATLKLLGLDDCIKTEETVLREVLKTHTQDEIMATGAYLETKDEFWFEVDKERLKPAE